MGKYTQIMTHEGTRILFTNGAGLTEAEYLAAIEEMKLALLREGKGTLALTDMTGVKATKAIIDKARESVAAVEAAGIKDSPSAVVGLSGLQRAVAQLFGKGVYYADTIDQAKEWLAKEDGKRRKR